MRRTLAVAIALVALTGCRQDSEAPVRLRLFCGAGIREPVSQIADDFEATRNVLIEADYAGSNILLTRIKTGGMGDLYIPGDRAYILQAEEHGLIESAEDACYFVPVILVAKGNPKDITCVADLAREGMRIGLGDAEACAIGKKSTAIIEKSGAAADDIEANVVFRSMTVNELGVQIQAGKIDACIVWDAIARSFAEHGDIVAIPLAENVVSTVPVAVLSTSEHKPAAREFQAFAVSALGRAVFARYGYTVDPPE